MSTPFTPVTPTTHRIQADPFGSVCYLLKLWRLACSCAMIAKDPRVVYQTTDLWLRVPMMMAKPNNIPMNYTTAVSKISMKDAESSIMLFFLVDEPTHYLDDLM
ncbi:hypothetical protein AKJ16_DCAP21501 [Drosera capensis]